MEHKHTHPHESVSAEEELALLKYMAQHNAHHAEELQETAGLLSDNAALLIREAVSLLNQSTEKIRQAIKESEGL